MTTYEQMLQARVVVVVDNDGAISVIKDRGGPTMRFDAEAVVVKADGAVAPFQPSVVQMPLPSEREGIGATVDERLASMDRNLAPMIVVRGAALYVGLVCDALAEHGYEVRKKP